MKGKYLFSISAKPSRWPDRVPVSWVS